MDVFTRLAKAHPTQKVRLEKIKKLYESSVTRVFLKIPLDANEEGLFLNYGPEHNVSELKTLDKDLQSEIRKFNNLVYSPTLDPTNKKNPDLILFIGVHGRLEPETWNESPQFEIHKPPDGMHVTFMSAVEPGVLNRYQEEYQENILFAVEERMKTGEIDPVTLQSDLRKIEKEYRRDELERVKKERKHTNYLKEYLKTKWEASRSTKEEYENFLKRPPGWNISRDKYINRGYSDDPTLPFLIKVLHSMPGSFFHRGDEFKVSELDEVKTMMNIKGDLDRDQLLQMVKRFGHRNVLILDGSCAAAFHVTERGKRYLRHTFRDLSGGTRTPKKLGFIRTRGQRSARHRH